MSNSANNESTRQNHAEADRFARRLMVNLAFVGFIVSLMILRNEALALAFAGICVAGLVSRELYLLWTFRGDPSGLGEGSSESLGRTNLLRVLIAVVVWLVFEASYGPLTFRSFIFAGASGLGLAAFLWWRETRSSGRKGRLPA